MTIDQGTTTAVEEFRRPRADRIVSSRHAPTMWELRHVQTEGAREINLRGPRRRRLDDGAVLPAGDKTGNCTAWYEKAVPAADALDDDLRRQHP